jgi:hypothetical protein
LLTIDPPRTTKLPAVPRAGAESAASDFAERVESDDAEAHAEAPTTTVARRGRENELKMVRVDMGGFLCESGSGVRDV